MHANFGSSFESFNVLVVKVKHKRANYSIVSEVDHFSDSLLHKVRQLSVTGHLHDQLNNLLLLLLSEQTFKVVVYGAKQVRSRYADSS